MQEISFSNNKYLYNQCLPPLLPHLHLCMLILIFSFTFNALSLYCVKPSKQDGVKIQEPPSTLTLRCESLISISPYSLSFTRQFTMSKAHEGETFPKCRAALKYHLILHPLISRMSHPRPPIFPESLTLWLYSTQSRVRTL